MVLLITLIITVFASWLLITNKIIRFVIGGLTTIILTALIIGVIANMIHHFGMKKETINYPEKKYIQLGQLNLQPICLLLIKLEITQIIM